MTLAEYPDAVPTYASAPELGFHGALSQEQQAIVAEIRNKVNDALARRRRDEMRMPPTSTTVLPLHVRSTLGTDKRQKPT